ncbi:MAG: hypothetical protein IT445_08370 [Phycisphaeraceae bacterium]|nr:hypothetical protein [Phycisphaeraceae bacterium]
MSRRILCLAVLCLLIVVKPCPAPILVRPVLKSFFETGDKPTQNDFVDLIDSHIDLTWTYGSPLGHTLQAGQLAAPFIPGGAIVSAALSDVRKLQPGELIGAADADFAASATLTTSSNLIDDRYLLGLRFGIEDSLGAWSQHFGFVDLSVDSLASLTPGAIHIYGFAYESDPATPITAFFIPEPAAVSILCMTVTMGLLRRGAGRHAD